jgi:hypothetical protein
MGGPAPLRSAVASARLAKKKAEKYVGLKIPMGLFSWLKQIPLSRCRKHTASFMIPGHGTPWRDQYSAADKRFFDPIKMAQKKRRIDSPSPGHVSKEED